MSSNGESEYDYVIVGAGSAGCVIANRLSEDAGAEVALIEAGRSDRSQLFTRPAMIALIHQVDQLKKKFDWGYKTAPQQHLDDRVIPYTRGRVLGGCGTVNGMLYVRGNRANYDSWAAEGCDGWSYDELLPYFTRSEDWQHEDTPFHGKGGPMKVTRHIPGQVSGVSEAFIAGTHEITGAPMIDDYNGASQEGSFFWQMSAADGTRYSTSEAFIHAFATRTNLHVELDLTVRRLVIENGRCVGVRALRNGKETIVRARKEVILAAGALGSPHLLMLSGVGPAAQLKQAGVQPVLDLPVGQNLHDHLFCPISFRAKGSGHRGTALHFFTGLAKEALRGGTWFGRTLFESGAFLKASSNSKIPDLQFHSLPWGYPDPNQDGPGRPRVDSGECFTIFSTLIYPKSRGELTLTSTDPAVAPRIDPHFLEHPDDSRLLARGYRIARDIVRGSKMKSFVQDELAPGGHRTSDQDLAAEIRLRAHTVYHPVGTCRMGKDERAVVHPDLRVRGLDGLRVADASIMPSVTGGNTNAPCIAIGERAAAFIRASAGRARDVPAFRSALAPSLP
jgi:choline dehydrogenase